MYDFSDDIGRGIQDFGMALGLAEEISEQESILDIAPEEETLGCLEDVDTAPEMVTIRERNVDEPCSFESVMLNEETLKSNTPPKLRTNWRDIF